MLPARISLIVAVALLAEAVFAHDYWFEYSADDYLLHRGHRFSQHQGEKEVPFDPKIVTGAYCLRPNDVNPSPAAVAGGNP